ncbi:MAG: hypothetical protein COA82_08230 [Alkaliphilus sp.]|nr:MAG: hypothetical protein COA82_08230 [Alkaliphilus sp.]
MKNETEYEEFEGMKEYLLKKIEINGFKHYIHDSILYFLKDGEMNEIDINALVAEMKISADRKEVIESIDARFAYDFFHIKTQLE